MAYRYGSRSLSRLGTADPDLVLLFTEALADPDCPCDITILEGHRGEWRQNEMKASGASQLSWPNSYHNRTPSMAVDAAPWVNGAVSWDWDHYHPLADHIKKVWRRLLVAGKVTGTLEWGGDWQRFRDGPHWQIKR